MTKQKYINKAIKTIVTGKYICPKCGHEMVVDQEWDDLIWCPNCNYDTDFDGYISNENYDDLYDIENTDPTDEDLMSEEDRLEAYYSEFDLEDF